MTKIKLLCKLIWQEYYFNIAKLQSYKSPNNIIEKLRMQVFPEAFLTIMQSLWFYVDVILLLTK